MKPPQKRPCGSCPYRKDVPSGVWDPCEYRKLIPYDLPTFEQPVNAFLCHQQDDHLCAGWVGCHDMNESLSLRIAAARGQLSAEEIDECLDYESPVELWESGAEAALHGLESVNDPDPKAKRTMQKIAKRRNLRRDES